MKTYLRLSPFHFLEHSAAWINCFLQKYMLLKKGEWVGSVKRILGLWHEAWQKFSPSTWVEHCPEKGIMCVVLGAPCAFREYIMFGQNPVGCWVTAWKVSGLPWWLGWLGFWRQFKRQKRPKKANSPVKHNNQLQRGRRAGESTQKTQKRKKNPVEGLKKGAKTKIGWSHHGSNKYG